MKKIEHDLFEMLAGAVLLGEATVAERDRFETHARGCDRCGDDAWCASGPMEWLARARDDETWRPSLRDDVIARVRASRTSRFRLTIGAFGWALALSIGVNLAIASGFSSRLGAAFSNAVEPVSYATTINARHARSVSVRRSLERVWTRRRVRIFERVGFEKRFGPRRAES